MPHVQAEGGGWVTVAAVYVGGYLALLLLAMCVATGLFYLAEVVEEHTRAAKQVLTVGTQAVLLLHVLLLLLDSQPVRCVLVGLAAHVCYAALLPRYPAFVPASPAFLAACALCALSHWLWAEHFWQHTYASAEFVAGFFAVAVWAVPFGLLLSMSANDGVLPSGGGAPRPREQGGGGGGWLSSVLGGWLGNKRNSRTPDGHAERY